MCKNCLNVDFVVRCSVFLIRDSQSVAGAYVLSFVHNHKVKHCPILRVCAAICWCVDYS